MEKEMININANLCSEVKCDTLNTQNGELEVANFSLVKKYGKNKEYINCSVYGKKVEIAKELKKGDLVHVFGYYKENKKGDKVYKNFVVKSLNKIEEKEEEI